MVREINHEQVTKDLGCGQLESGRGLNQEQCLQRPRDTWWSSHYKTLKGMIDMFSTIIEVLKVVGKDDRDWRNRDHASNLLVYFQSFDFVFYLHLMLTTLVITNTLSLALQGKDQDIVNAIKLVKATRLSLDNLRRDGWARLLDEVNEFCDSYDIARLEMEDAYVNPQQPRKNLESQISITMKWIVLMRLLIGWFKSLIAASTRQALSCFFSQLLLV
jgi:hypothetical protein